jgi:hypothetical protein
MIYPKLNRNDENKSVQLKDSNSEENTTLPGEDWLEV